MRRYHALLVCLACSLAGVMAFSRSGTLLPDLNLPGLPDILVAKSVPEQDSAYEPEREHVAGSVLGLEAYEDPDYGFSMAVPAGWRRIVTAEATQGNDVQAAGIAVPQDGTTTSAAGLDLLWQEPGYAVGFESAQQHENDRFADYILVEILPGGFSGLFTSDPSQRQPAVIDGRSTWYDRLEVKQATTGLTDMDLVIYQAELSGVGYTVGLYAIGENASERIMAIAFEIMLQTFSMDRAPFSVS